jgi:hypothetical protein
MLAAVKLNQPLLVITDDQGNDLAKCTADIVKEYGLTVSTKMALFTQLFMVCVGIYAPKIMAIKAQNKANEPAQFQA